MEVEKRSSKGGLIQLFDWNVKAKKKLFSNKSELPEGSKQGKEKSYCSSSSQRQQMKVNDNDPSPSSSISKHYNCSSSVNSDEGCMSREPGVVARLMGLDSLPSSDVSDPHFTPVCYSKSFHPIKSDTKFKSEHHMIGYGNMRNQVGGFSKNPVELELQKVPNRPIERFQTEILPPKSAKSIPITHHRLLSPIRGIGFVPTKNAANIMEAAAKMIEQSPHSTANVKLASFASSSIPLRIRDLKEKMEAAARKASLLPETSQRPQGHSSLKLVKGQPSERNQRGSEETRVLKAFVTSRRIGSDNLKDKEKSDSLAIQAKVNVGKREGFNRSFMNQKGDNEVKLSKVEKNQHKQKNGKNRTSTGRTPNVLSQNNQKQNCAANKESINTKPSASNQKNRKLVSMNSSLRPSKVVSKVVVNSMIGTKRTNLLATNSGKEPSSSRTINFFTKKQLVNEDAHVDRSPVDNVLVKRSERPVKCNVPVDGCSKLDAGDRNNCTDVVSFTFTSPVKKLSLESNAAGQAIEKSNSLCFAPYGDQSNSKNSSLSSLGLNMIGGDALSALLDQKLKELTCRLEASHHAIVKTGLASSSASSLHTSLSTLKNEGKTKFTENDKRSQFGQHEVKQEIQYDIECTLVDGLLPKAEQKWQEQEAFKSNNNGKYGKEHYYQYSSAVSNLEHSFSEESCNSSDSKASVSSIGCSGCSLAEAYEKVNWISAEVPPPVNGEMELSDSTSSTYAGSKREHIRATFMFTKFDSSFDWLLKYVRCVLSSAEMMLMEFATGQASTIISPDLFDQLENKKASSDKNMDEQWKIGRKILFDCVNDCLESRCGLPFGRPFKAWSKWTTLSWKECLAQELSREILSWTSMEDLMVDELVDKDMSTHHGKWVDFEREILEEGVEIENGILTILVDELVADLLVIF